MIYYHPDSGRRVTTEQRIYVECRSRGAYAEASYELRQFLCASGAGALRAARRCHYDVRNAFVETWVAGSYGSPRDRLAVERVRTARVTT